ncbi:MAG: TonB-dependent receptor [Acidobacteriota bacterium]
MTASARWIGCVAALAACAVARAGGPDASGSEDEEMKALMQVLEEETAIATRTKMNSDYVPGTVTVLHGDEMEALGARTVGEALSMVPGVMTLFESIGTPIVTVRGVVFPFNSGNIKVMVDGIAMTQQSAAVNSAVLMLPIEIVDRIELIRGPGSTIHGDFAFAGLLNVVTRQDERRAFLEGDGFGSIEGGTSLWFSPGKDQHLGLNVCGIRSNDALAPVGTDAQEQRVAGSASYRYKGFTASLHVVDRDRDQDGDHIVDEHSAVAQLRHVATLAGSLESDARIAYLQNRFELPETEFDGGRASAEWYVTWKGLSHQSWLFGIDYQETDIDKAIHRPPLPPEVAPAPEDASGAVRRISGVSVQDQIDIGKLALTVGLRYERLDATDELTPRLAFVFRATDSQILKAQYAEGYRAPNFFELYGTAERNDDLDPERVDTTEVSYIYKRSSWVGRATLFSSRLEDLIQPAFIPPPGEGTLFANVASARAKGGELEWEQKVSSMVKVSANVSYADVGDDRPFGEGPRWMGNLALYVQPWEKLVAALHLYHVGTRGQGAESVPGFDLADLTLTLTDLPEGFVFRGGLKNAFDDEVVVLMAAPGARNTFEVDTRTWWVQAAYRF